MDRGAIFVDAGHVFAAGSLLLTGKVLKRGELQLDHDRFLAFLRSKLDELSGLPLLRVYWYDGASSGPNPAQLDLAYRADVKLRLGLVSPLGQQKGVDSLIVTDLITLSRNRAMASALLVTGDEDLGLGLMQAQEHGVRIHLLAIAPAKGMAGVTSGVSAVLRQEADTFTAITREEVQQFLNPQPHAPAENAAASGASLPAGATELDEALPPGEGVAAAEPAEAPPLAGPADEAAETVVSALLAELTPSAVALVATQGSPWSIPAGVDRQLLAVASKRLGLNPLPEELRQKTRRLLFERCRQQAGLPPPTS
jgi:uncharacterized LabA/DUF88 family protein